MFLVCAGGSFATGHERPVVVADGDHALVATHAVGALEDDQAEEVAAEWTQEVQQASLFQLTV